MKIKKGDNVLVTTGKSKGKVGKVAYALPKKNKVVVEGANIHKRHTRAPQRDAKGQIVELPMPFSVSNIKLICAACEKAIRIGYRLEGSDKIRICVKCKKAVA